MLFLRLLLRRKMLVVGKLCEEVCIKMVRCCDDGDDGDVEMLARTYCYIVVSVAACLDGNGPHQCTV